MESSVSGQPWDPVPIENLNSDVLMMEPAEDRYRSDATDLLLPPELRSIFIQWEMGPDVIVVWSVSLEDTAQVRLAEHDEVIERFAPYRSDEPFHMAVLPQRKALSK
jgi:hypothetical protein